MMQPLPLEINYLDYDLVRPQLPRSGKHIVAFQQQDSIVVYQAYKKSIADYAVKHQKLGGPDFKFSRMSWIKPGFLWMMYRSGWASKLNQERILAIWISKRNFDKILGLSVHSVFDEKRGTSLPEWKEALEKSEVRIQWDPDHDPNGNRLERRAIQLGLRGDTLKSFAEQYILQIADITKMVHEQFAYVREGRLDKLKIPFEKTYVPDADWIRKYLELDLSR